MGEKRHTKRIRLSKNKFKKNKKKEEEEKVVVVKKKKKPQKIKIARNITQLTTGLNVCLNCSVWRS